MGCCAAAPEKTAKPFAPQADNLIGRPPGATGQFLRMLSINDVYILDNYANLATAVLQYRKLSESLDCVVTSHLNGDFLSPCLQTALDGGTAMMEGLNYAKLDYACLGNHEFDMDKAQLQMRLPLYKGKIINTNGQDAELASLSHWDIVDVGARKVLITGLCTGDRSIYAEKSCPTMLPFLESCQTAWKNASQFSETSTGNKLDIMVPMTHQLIEEDRDFALAIQKDSTLSGKVPVILGGHEHTIFEETAGDTLIVKTGQDGGKIAIVDVWWTAEGKVQSRHVMVPASQFTPEPVAAKWAAQKKDFVEKALQAAITELPSKMSTKMVRYEECDLAGFLLAKLKRGLHQHAAEVVMMNAGDIRGRADYEPGPFTLDDLYKEIAFDEEMAVVPMKGSVIAEAVKFSRLGSDQKPGFLQLDADCSTDAENNLLTINQQPFDPDKEYKVGVQRAILNGMNSITPLIEYAKERGVPDEEACVFAKTAIIQVCMKDLWREMLNFPAFDVNNDGNVDTKELRAGLLAVFKELDKDQSGQADASEVANFLQARLPKYFSRSLAEQLFQAADKDGNGKLQIDELAKCVQ